MSRAQTLTLIAVCSPSREVCQRAVDFIVTRFYGSWLLSALTHHTYLHQTAQAQAVCVVSGPNPLSEIWFQYCKCHIVSHSLIQRKQSRPGLPGRHSDFGECILGDTLWSPHPHVVIRVLCVLCMSCILCIYLSHVSHVYYLYCEPYVYYVIYNLCVIYNLHIIYNM